MGSGDTLVELSSEDEGCGGNNSDISISSWTTDSDEHVGREVVDVRDGVKVECEVSSSTICIEDNSSMCMRKGESCIDSDDDCIIVENKPDNILAVSNDCEGGGEVDELFIVRETGELACRDYPHPRYLCSKFPFSMTPHQKHCTMCHCYVCDIPAPCNYWTAGDPIAGHCHATHKDKIWRAERIIIREKKKNPVDSKHVSKPSCNAQHDWLDKFDYHGSTSVFNSVRPPTLLADNTITNSLNPGLACSFGHRQIPQLRPAPGGPNPLRMRAVAGSSLTAQGMQSFPRFKRSATKSSSVRVTKGQE